jgi:hypothetical protein
MRQQPVAQLEHQLDAGEATADDGDSRLGDLAGDLGQPPVKGDPDYPDISANLKVRRG